MLLKVRSFVNFLEFHFTNTYFTVILITLCTHHTLAKEIRFMCLQPMTGTSWPGGASCIAPIQMALDDVNSNPDILPDYQLSCDIVDSQVCLICPSTTFKLYYSFPNMSSVDYIHTIIFKNNILCSKC